MVLAFGDKKFFFQSVRKDTNYSEQKMYLCRLFSTLEFIT